MARTGFTGIAAAATLLCAGCTVVSTGNAIAVPTGTVPASTGPTVQCQFTASPRDPSPRPVQLPSSTASRLGSVQVTLKLGQGAVPMTLNRTEAPCTVASFVSLSQQGFFTNTPCHRLTAYVEPPLKVLQCGDPTGTGTGGPGYTIPDENPTNLAPAPPDGGSQQSVIYPAGTVAMANTGQPHSGGSQFFLVYADTYLPPSYAVFATVSPAGLSVLSSIAAAGITPGTDASSGSSTPTDGKPASPVIIQQATVG